MDKSLADSSRIKGRMLSKDRNENGKTAKDNTEIFLGEILRS